MAGHSARALQSSRSRGTFRPADIVAALTPFPGAEGLQALLDPALPPALLAITGRADRALILCGTNLTESMLDHACARPPSRRFSRAPTAPASSSKTAAKGSPCSSRPAAKAPTKAPSIPRLRRARRRVGRGATGIPRRLERHLPAMGRRPRTAHHRPHARPVAPTLRQPVVHQAPRHLLVTTPSPVGLWRPPAWCAFLWGFAEATLFFLVPDIILTWCALASPRCGSRALVAVLAGSILGGALVYSAASARPAQTTRVIQTVPFVRASMFETVSREYERHGAVAQLLGRPRAFSYKVYASVAPAHVNFATFLAFSIPARLERLAASWILFTILGVVLRRAISRHRVLTAAIFRDWLGDVLRHLLVQNLTPMRQSLRPGTRRPAPHPSLRRALSRDGSAPLARRNARLAMAARHAARPPRLGERPLLSRALLASLLRARRPEILGRLSSPPDAHEGRHHRDFPDRILARGESVERLIVSRSSGSTGKALDVAYDARATALFILAGLRLYRMGSPTAPWHRQLYVYTSPYPLDSLFGLFPLHFVPTLAPVADIVAAIRRRRPDLLVCYPSHLKQIAQAIPADKRSQLGLQCISVNSEMSTQAERDDLSGNSPALCSTNILRGAHPHRRAMPPRRLPRLRGYQLPRIHPQRVRRFPPRGNEPP